MKQRKARAQAEVFEDGTIEWSFYFDDEQVRRFDIANLYTTLSQMQHKLLSNVNSHDTNQNDPEASSRLPAFIPS